MESWIAFVALVVSIIVGISQYISNKKVNEASDLANKIQLQQNEFDIKKGEILLLGLTGRYFILVINNWEENGKMRKDKLSIKKYLAGLKSLDRDFNELLGNTFYINLLEVYPDINLLLVSLRSEIIDKEENINPGVDGKTFDLFYNLYFSLKRNIKYSRSFDSNYYKHIDEAANFLKVELDKLRLRNIK